MICKSCGNDHLLYSNIDRLKYQPRPEFKDDERISMKKLEDILIVICVATMFLLILL